MYNWIQTNFQVSEGLAQGLQLVISLAVVLALFGLFIFIIKRLMGSRAPQSRGRQPRIALMDSAAIDSRRRLLLVRRDNIEHLILVGGPSDVVVEQNIIRNAPLAAGQPRSGAYQTPQQAGSIKAPMAPGPDIPITPEDSAAAPPPAPSAPDEAPVQSAPPAQPSSPAVRPSTPPSAPQASPPPAQKSPAFGGSSRTSMGAMSATGISTSSAKEKPLPASSFSQPRREKAPPAEPRAHAPGPAESTTPATPETAKSDIPAPAPKANKESDQTTKKASPLRALTRPFSPKDRPSYGSGKISPPASGPAARVKTALVNPSDTDTQPGRVEPKLGGAGLSGSVSFTDKISAESKTPAKAEEPSASTPPALSEENSANKDKADLTDAVAEGIEKELFSEPKPAADASAPNSGEASEEKPADPVAAAPAADQIDSQEKAEPEAPAENTAKSGDDQKPVGNTASSDPDSEKGIGDRNPIEAEMAKILDELGGQPKQ
ncbi:hypothetical protein [Roseibium sp.]|uniref:hypothetical protein n=1 Tax=Roseibium sp. TaxID=1936156 RepID=UPI003B51A778